MKLGIDNAIREKIVIEMILNLNVVCKYLCSLEKFFFDKYLGIKNGRPSLKPKVVNIKTIDTIDIPNE